MIYPDGGDVSHPQRHRSSNPGMARHDAVRTIDQNRIDKTKFLNAGSDLFDLPGCVRAGIFETGFELAWIFVFDGQRLHSAPHARLPGNGILRPETKVPKRPSTSKLQRLSAAHVTQRRLCLAESGSNVGLLGRKSEHLVLPGPFGRQVAEAHNSYPMWKPSLDGSLHEVGREEGERDRHVDLATLHCSRFAMLSAVAVASAMSSSSQRRPRAIDATRVARVSDRIGRAC